ncbi:MAG: hypothetical protein ACLFOY_01625 [Desulfatibacillaceae bacterium]
MPKKAASSKTQNKGSDFYVVRTIQKATDSTSNVLKDYNEKYVRKTFESGKYFVEDFSKGTYEALGGALEDGRKLVSRIPMVEKVVSGADGQEVFVVRTWKKAKDNTTTTLKEYNELLKGYNDKYVKKAMENGKGVVDNVEKNAREAVDGVRADSRKVRDIITDTVDKQVAKVLSSLTEKADLPTKKDIAKLTKSIDAFNKKMEKIVVKAAS